MYLLVIAKHFLIKFFNTCMKLITFVVVNALAMLQPYKSDPQSALVLVIV